jgi:hypothetical protein
MVPILSATWLLLAAPAAAVEAPPGPARSLVVIVDTTPALPEATRGPVQQGLKSEVDNSLGFTWVDPPAISLDELSLALNCGGLDEACIRKLGVTVKADAVILVSATATPRAELTMTMVQIKPPRPARVVAVPLLEPGPTTEGARKAVRTLLGPVKPTRLVVTTQPPGALVQVDGVARGRTPAALVDLRQGAHRIHVALPGYVPQTTEVTLESGKSTEVVLTLTPGAAAPGPGPAAHAAAASAPVVSSAPAEEGGGGGKSWAFFASRVVVGLGLAGAVLGLLALPPGVLTMPGGLLGYMGVWAANTAAPAAALQVGLNQATAFMFWDFWFVFALLGGAGVGLGLLVGLVGAVTAGAGVVWVALE